MSDGHFMPTLTQVAGDYIKREEYLRSRTSAFTGHYNGTAPLSAVHDITRDRIRHAPVDEIAITIERTYMNPARDAVDLVGRINAAAIPKVLGLAMRSMQGFLMNVYNKGPLSTINDKDAEDRLRFYLSDERVEEMYIAHRAAQRLKG